MHESYPNVRDGRKTVTTAGTRVQLSTTNTICRKIEIQALSANTNYVFVGDITVVAATGSERGIRLAPGAVITMYVQDLYSLYLDSRVSGEGVSYVYYF